MCAWAAKDPTDTTLYEVPKQLQRLRNEGILPQITVPEKYNRNFAKIVDAPVTNPDPEMKYRWQNKTQ